MKKIFNILVVSIMLFLFVSNFNGDSYADDNIEESEKVHLEEEVIQASANSKDEPILNSRFAIVFDRISKKIIYGKEENKRRPMVSTTNVISYQR